MDYVELCLAMNCSEEKFAKVMHYQEVKLLAGATLAGLLIVCLFYILYKIWRETE